MSSNIDKKSDLKVYLCLQCGHVLADKYRMREHVKNRHQTQECEICFKKIANLKEKEKHLSKEHCKNFTCDTCGKKFTNKKSLSKHVRYVHIGRHCPHCNILLLEKHRTKHLHEVHGVKVPTCGICGFRDRATSRIVEHQRMVHLKEKYVSCDQCELKFFNITRLRKHQISHSSERKFECNFCHKKFPRKTTLAMHTKIHTGEKNKVCSECGEKFVQKASLNYHMARHHPGQKFD